MMTSHHSTHSRGEYKDTPLTHIDSAKLSKETKMIAEITVGNLIIEDYGAEEGHLVICKADGITLCGEYKVSLNGVQIMSTPTRRIAELFFELMTITNPEDWIAFYSTSGDWEKFDEHGYPPFLIEGDEYAMEWYQIPSV